MTARNGKNGDIKESNGQIVSLRESIRQAFPIVAYSGKITNRDLELDDPSLDEEKDLHDALKGKRWSDIPRELLLSLPDGYVLLSDAAFVSFLPAWLLYALENIDGENEVRNFVVYAFSPKHDMVPDTTNQILDRLRLLNPEQRSTVRSLLEEFTKRGTSPFVKTLALKAVTLIDQVK